MADEGLEFEGDDVAPVPGTTDAGISNAATGDDTAATTGELAPNKDHAAQTNTAAGGTTAAPSGGAAEGDHANKNAEVLYTTLFVKGIDPDEADEDIWKGKVSGYAGVSSDDVRLLNFPKSISDECSLTFKTTEAAAKCRAALEEKGLTLRFGTVAEQPKDRLANGGVTVTSNKRNFLDEPLDSLVDHNKRRKVVDDKPIQPGEHQKGKGWKQASREQYGFYEPYEPQHMDPFPFGYDIYGKGASKKGNKGMKKGADGKAYQYLDPNLPSWLANKNYGTQIDLTKGKRAANQKGRKGFLDSKAAFQGDGPGLGKGGEGPPQLSGKKGNAYALPDEPVSKWKPEMSLDRQLVDYLNMKRHGNLNRYLVLSGLNDHTMNCAQLRREFDWPLLDGSTAILSIELHTMMGKDVAHLAMKDVKSAVQLKKYVEENQSRYGTTRVAHAAPRKAGRTLWIGGLPADFEPEPWFLKPLKMRLEQYGKLVPQPEPELKPAWWEIDSPKKNENPPSPEKAKEQEETNKNDTTDAKNANKPGTSPTGQARQDGGDVEKKNTDGTTAVEQKAAGDESAENKNKDSATATETNTEKKSDEQKADGGNKETSKDNTTAAEGEGAKKDDAGDENKAEKAGTSPANKVEGDKAKESTQGAGAGESKDEQPKKPPLYIHYIPKKHCAFVTFETVQQAIQARNHLYALPLPTHVGDSKENNKSGKETEKDPTLSLHKMGEFCCKVKANYIQGTGKLPFESKKLEIDQRTKLEHLMGHYNKNERFAVYNIRPKERGDIPNFNELVTYFSDRKRVGLVQAAKNSCYLVPGKKEGFLDELPFLNEVSRGDEVKDGFILIMIPALSAADKEKKKQQPATGATQPATANGTSAAAGAAPAAAEGQHQAAANDSLKNIKGEAAPSKKAS
ncbi:unnamed protein product [Amoebophrya sp. A120]|nr:unnamed protein product [Amoebophrya sp. A120]|eukprot:GSA120T00000677001.1